MLFPSYFLSLVPLIGLARSRARPNFFFNSFRRNELKINPSSNLFGTKSYKPVKNIESWLREFAKFQELTTPGIGVCFFFSVLELSKTGDHRSLISLKREETLE
jgi:hypothetical protein